jgi:hypothetical protein
MRDRFAGSMISVSIAAAAVVPLSNTQTSAQAPAASIAAPAPAQALKTPWGEPDLQGIWTDEFDTPFQRPAKYANQEFFTEEQREDLNKERATLLGRRATERELIGAYNIAVFMSTKHTGARTSLIADPPNGRIPPLTPEGQKRSPPIGNFVSPCCNRPTRARTRRCNATGADTIPHPRRGARSLLLATTSRASTAMMAQRMERCLTAA